MALLWTAKGIDMEWRSSYYSAPNNEWGERESEKSNDEQTSVTAWPMSKH